MNSWINLNAVGLILGLGLVFGAGLPALFAVGLRALNAPGAPATGDDEAVLMTKPSPVRMAAAVCCFAVVVAAIAAGIYLIVAMT
jgi:hypothetical protein